MGANLVQSNTISGVLSSNYNVPTWLTGVILICCLMAVVLGGLKRIANIATSLVPIMSIFYVVVGLLVILLNIQEVPSVIKEIFTQAFSMKAVAGGTGGYVIAKAMQYGITRGMYSNEAGEGTAPFAHGSAIVDHPCEEGITGVTEVLFRYNNNLFNNSNSYWSNWNLPIRFKSSSNGNRIFWNSMGSIKTFSNFCTFAFLFHNFNGTMV